MQAWDPLQIISVFELFLAAGISLVLGVSIINRYREKPARGTLLFIIIFIFTGLALSFVGIDRILLISLADPGPGLTFHNFAVFMSLGVILLLDIFAFEMTYPNHIKKLTLLVSLLIIIAGIFLFLNPPFLGSQQEILYSDELLYLVLPFLGPPILIPIIVFFYYSAKVREESVAKSNRVFVMGVAGLSVAIGYIFELMGITGVLVIIIRLTFVIFTFLMYIAFTMPLWFKKLIGDVDLS